MDFGYQPEPRDLVGVVKWFRERGHGRTPKSAAPMAGGKCHALWGMGVKIVLAAAVFMLIMYCIPLAS